MRALPTFLERPCDGQVPAAVLSSAGQWSAPIDAVMRRLPILIAAGLLAGPALAQEPDWGKAPQVVVTLSSFAFDPSLIHLMPAAGHYKLRCTHTMHAMFGMTGEIVVD
jgi:hypothetical protein